jgi:hypothetical protein
MKYLKVFESFDFIDYSEIDIDIYDDDCSSENFSEMSENDFLLIQKILRSKGWKFFDAFKANFEKSESFSDVCEVIYYKSGKSKSGKREKVVITYVNDKVYYVCWIKNQKKFYEADRIRGLMKLLENEIFKD